MDATQGTSEPQEDPIIFRSDVEVGLVRASARDSDVVFAARVSTLGEASLEDVEADPERSSGLIRYLMRERHGSPFEHTSMTFFVRAPIFVFREFQRHRVASYNEESGRYRQLASVFYVPSQDRALRQVGKVGHYTFEPGTTEQHDLVRAEFEDSCTRAYVSYVRMLDAGVAREVARAVLPLTTYSSMYVTLNARALMNFLSLRTHRENAVHVSHPQREIEMCAEAMEQHWRRLMPITADAFDAAGRIAP